MCGNPSKVSTLFVTLADHMTSPDHVTSPERTALYQRLQNFEYILSIMYKKNDRYCHGYGGSTTVAKATLILLDFLLIL